MVRPLSRIRKLEQYIGAHAKIPPQHAYRRCPILRTSIQILYDTERSIVKNVNTLVKAKAAFAVVDQTPPWAVYTLMRTVINPFAELNIEGLLRRSVMKLSSGLLVHENMAQQPYVVMLPLIPEPQKSNDTCCRAQSNERKYRVAQ